MIPALQLISPIGAAVTLALSVVLVREFKATR